jgi:uncharacterized phage protein (TIGR02218 family)
VNIAELIEFSSRTFTWRWTTSNKNIVSSGYTYVPFLGGTGNGIEESIDLGIATIDFVVTNSGNDMEPVITANDLDMASIIVRRIHVGTPDAGSVEIFRGKVGDYTLNRDQVNGQARNFFNSINVQWPMYTYMDACAWRFGSEGCGFDTSSVTISTTAYPVSSGYRLGAFLNIASREIAYFEKGRFTFTSGSNSGQARSVRVHSGTRVEFSHSMPYTIASGDQFQIYPGCRKRLVDDCTSKYNNDRNFLGFPWIPKQENAF